MYYILYIIIYFALTMYAYKTIVYISFLDVDNNHILKN